MKLAFIIDPIAALDPTHDSSVAMMEAACQQNHDVWTTQMRIFSGCSADNAENSSSSGARDDDSK
jgi:glutathione synthase/RimK-type ligase-like ATP-grasp enzyme